MIRLGLSASDFFRLTPRQLHVLVERDRERIEQHEIHQELLAGIIAATVANYSLAGTKKAKSPADFMPSQLRKAKRTPRPRRAPRRLIVQNIRCFLKAQVEAQKHGNQTSGS